MLPFLNFRMVTLVDAYSYGSKTAALDFVAALVTSTASLPMHNSSASSAWHPADNKALPPWAFFVFQRN
jgi:hypothetical protein